MEQRTIDLGDAGAVSISGEVHPFDMTPKVAAWWARLVALLSDPPAVPPPRPDTPKGDPPAGDDGRVIAAAAARTAVPNRAAPPKARAEAAPPPNPPTRPPVTPAPAAPPPPIPLRPHPTPCLPIIDPAAGGRSAAAILASLGRPAAALPVTVRNQLQALANDAAQASNLAEVTKVADTHRRRWGAGDREEIRRAVGLAPSPAAVVEFVDDFADAAFQARGAA